jgi:hypothetical protein
MMDDDLPEGEPPPKLLMSDFSAQMLSVETKGSPLWLVDRATLLLTEPASKLRDRLLPLHRSCPAEPLRWSVTPFRRRISRTGRIGPALKLLEELPGAITGTAEAIYAEGREMGRRSAARAAKKPAASSGPGTAPGVSKAPRRSLAGHPPSNPIYARQAVELAEHISRLGADRVAEVLRVRLADLEMLLAGWAAVSKTGMKRLRETSD